MKPLTNSLITLAFLIFLTLPAYSQFQWTENGVPVRAGNHLSENWSVAENSSGDIFAVWGDARDNSAALYAQKFDSQGNSQWQSDALLVHASAILFEMCPTSDGGCAVVWAEFIQYNYAMIYAQKAAADGSVLWGEHGIEIGHIVFAYGDQEGGGTRPTIVSDDMGGVYIAWIDETQSNYFTLFTSRLLADGSYAPGFEPGGNAVAAPVGIVINYYQPPACRDGQNGLLIAFRRSYLNGNLAIQRLDSRGNLQWGPEGVVVTDSSVEFWSQYLVEDGSNGAFIIWEQRVDQSYYLTDLYMQRVDGSGNVQWQENGLPLVHEEEWQHGVVAEPDGSGGFVAAWVDARYDDNDPDIFCQRVDAAGSCLWDFNGLPLSLADGDQQMVDIDSDGNGGFYASWASWDGSTFSERDSYIQRVDGTGQVQWPTNGLLLSGGDDNCVHETKPICTATGALFFRREAHEDLMGIYIKETDPYGNILTQGIGIPVVEAIAGSLWDEEFQLVPLSADHSLLAWTDMRFSITDNRRVYYQILDQDGIALLENFGIPLCPDTPGEQVVNASAQSSDECALIVWRDNRTFSQYSKDYVQKIDAEGNLLWDSDGVQVMPGCDNGWETSAFADAEGGAFIIVKVSDGVSLQHLDSNGNRLLGDTGAHLDISMGMYIELQFLQDGQGSLLALKCDDSLDEILLYCISDEGQINWATPVYCMGYNIRNAVAAPYSDGGAVIAWEDERNSDEQDIYAQRIDGDGYFMWSPGGIPVVEDPDENYIDPGLIEAADGSIFITWEAGWSDLFCQRLSPYGVRTFPDEGVTICDADGEQDDPVMIADTSGGVIFCWRDMREYEVYSADLYCAHLNASGGFADPVWQTGGNPVGIIEGYQNLMAQAAPSLPGWIHAFSGPSQIFMLSES